MGIFLIVIIFIFCKIARFENLASNNGRCKLKHFLSEISPAQDSRSQNYRELEKWDKHWVPEIFTKNISESVQKQGKQPRLSFVCIWVKCIGVINSFLLDLSVTQSCEASDASWPSWRGSWHPGCLQGGCTCLVMMSMWSLSLPANSIGTVA